MNYYLARFVGFSAQIEAANADEAWEYADFIARKSNTSVVSLEWIGVIVRKS